MRSFIAGRLRTVPPSHTSQRIKVGAIGLSAVVLLIVLAAAIFGAVARERPMAAPGGAKPEIVANMAAANQIEAGRALSDMGVAPGIGNTAATAR